MIFKIIIFLFLLFNNYSLFEVIIKMINNNLDDIKIFKIIEKAYIYQRRDELQENESRLFHRHTVYSINAITIAT